MKDISNLRSLTSPKSAFGRFFFCVYLCSHLAATLSIQFAYTYHPTSKNTFLTHNGAQTVIPRKPKYLQKAAANARAARHPRKNSSPPVSDKEHSVPIEPTVSYYDGSASLDGQEPLDTLDDCSWDSDESDCDYGRQR
jgi:hypothetical protein